MDFNPLQIIVDASTSLARATLAHLPQITIALFILVLTPFIGRAIRSVIHGVMERTKVRQALVTLSARTSPASRRGSSASRSRS